MGKKKPIVTNAMRLLDAAGVAYRAVEYETDGAVGAHFGVEIAEKTGIPCAQSFKTLVARGDKTGVMAVCIPVDKELDLKKLAKASGNKRVELIHVKELPGLTGYIRGGVSPIGMKKQYPTYIDSACMGQEQVAVSAGVCGCTLLLAPADLLAFTKAEAADIAV